MAFFKQQPTKFNQMPFWFKNLRCIQIIICLNIIVTRRYLTLNNLLGETLVNLFFMLSIYIKILSEAFINVFFLV